jgi:uncharacterized protein with von Willebrand factor type A (vWA) domain
VNGKSVEHDVVAFARALRSAGLPVGVDQTEAFARALTLVDATSRQELYLAARATLVFRKEDIPPFDALFAAHWGSEVPVATPRKAPRAPRHDRPPQRTAFAAYMAERAGRDDPPIAVPDRAKAASAQELLQRKDFSELTEAERQSMRRAMRELRFDPARRETRRTVTARRGDVVDMRRLLRRASRHGGAIFDVPRRRRDVKRRPLVVLADVSGSMELYSRIFLQFLHGLTRLHRPTETFVFGTRLTRITEQLQLRDVDEALDRAAAAILDFAGGTRIGECIRRFNRVHAQRVLRRGAVVLLISDGWETGDPAELGAELGRLKRRSHRVVWLNPLLGRSTYEPLVAGMAIALDHVDDFLPIHNLESLQDLSRHLSRLPARRGARARPRAKARRTMP